MKLALERDDQVGETRRPRAAERTEITWNIYQQLSTLRDTETGPRVRGVQSIRAVSRAPIQPIFYLQASKGDYQAGIGNIRPISTDLILHRWDRRPRHLQ